MGDLETSMNYYKYVFWILLGVISFQLLCQEKVMAEKEILGKIEVGSESGKVQYYSSPEGLFSPNGPFVDGEGVLHFIPTTSYSKIISFSKGIFKDSPFPQGWPQLSEGLPSLQFYSQQGVILFGFGFFSYKEGRTTNVDFREYLPNDVIKDLKGGTICITPWGFLIDYSISKKCFSLERLGVNKFKLRNLEDTMGWITSQKGGFSIGNDGIIYRNNLVYSIPERYNNYIGRLMSGHSLFKNGGTPGYERFFSISGSNGKNELILEIPWAPKDNEDGNFRFFNYGIGSWGEIYILIAPPNLPGGEWYEPNPKYPVELVVVRNHLKYFGRTNADNVRMRKEPLATSDIIVELPKKAGFRILERNGKNETIGGKTSDWVKVRYLDGREGWIFGAFVDNLFDGPGTPPPWPNVPDW
jgi:hypothetical protein